MKKLLASVMLASVATTAFAIPPSHPQPLLGEAKSTTTVQSAPPTDLTLSENGFDRTPLNERVVDDAIDSTPQPERLAEDGFDLTPLADQIADDGFGRTPLGQLLAEDGSDRTGLGTS
ncbi:hypothetical protein [Pseudomonas sp.]|uniref:hypothetical protein n=1 Tax=Pseudomonas sp. TaxID=306 RepID=UPI0028AF3A36|nr:hypothetical protein [Pseudomonas sp.]